MKDTVKHAAHTKWLDGKPLEWPWGYYDNGIPKNATCMCGHDSGVHAWDSPHGCASEMTRCRCAEFHHADDPEEHIRRAAPELLEALEAILDITPFAKDAWSAEIHERARTAIRKARGE